MSLVPPLGSVTWVMTTDTWVVRVRLVLSLFVSLPLTDQPKPHQIDQERTTWSKLPQKMSIPLTLQRALQPNTPLPSASLTGHSA